MFVFIFDIINRKADYIYTREHQRQCLIRYDEFINFDFPIAFPGIVAVLYRKLSSDELIIEMARKG